MKIRLVVSPNVDLSKADEAFSFVSFYLATPCSADWQGPITGILDTGANCTTLNYQDVNKLSVNAKAIAGPKTAIGVGGEVDAGQASQLDIAILSPNTSEHFGMLSAPVFISDKIPVSIIGQDLLKFYDVIISAGKLVCLKPNLSALATLRRIG